MNSIKNENIKDILDNNINNIFFSLDYEGRPIFELDPSVNSLEIINDKRVLLDNSVCIKEAQIVAQGSILSELYDVLITTTFSAQELKYFDTITLYYKTEQDIIPFYRKALHPEDVRSGKNIRVELSLSVPYEYNFTSI